MGGTLSIEDGSFTMGINVKLTKRDKKTGKILETREGHNKCLKMQLMGIVKWLNGEFNDTQSYLLHYDWIPRYLGVGTNIATSTSPIGISSEVTINDTRLLNEISPRMKLPDRNTVVNRSTQNYVQLIITTYLPEEYYNGETIAEAGLFSRETGNNCLFRIVFDGIPKTEDSVIEVSWTISVISVSSENTPYTEVDKVDLRAELNRLLDLFATKYPDLTSACNAMKSPGIYEYGRLDAKQADVDAATLLLSQEYNKLKTT